jgi:hypothetical protein
MSEVADWIFFKNIDWNNSKANRFSIDTRDFHCLAIFNEIPHKDYDTLSKYDHFFFTEEELKTLIDRFFSESGGEKDWRFFTLETMQNWGLKYIRIARTEKGFIVCNSDWKALSKEVLNGKVERQH